MDRADAEASIVSQVLRNVELMDEITTLRPHLLNRNHRYILDCVEILQRKGIAVNRLSISERIGDVVSMTEISEIWNRPFVKMSFNERVEFVWEEIERDKLIFYFSSFADSLRMKKPVKEVMANHEEAMTAIDNLDSPVDISPLGEAMVREGEALKIRMESDGANCVPSGFPILDGYLGGGFQPNRLYYIGARPSVGKTALMLNFAAKAVGRMHSVGIVSVESTEGELMRRMIAREAQVNASKIQDGQNISEIELARIENAIENAKQSPGVIYHKPTATISEISSIARRMKRVNGIKALFVDYTQLIKTEQQFRNRVDQVGYISTQLKVIAIENNIAVIALAQLTRESDSYGETKSKVPRLRDFSDSSQIEKDADFAGLLHRESQFRVDLYVAKNRDGAQGRVSMKFDQEYLRFTEMNYWED